MKTLEADAVKAESKLKITLQDLEKLKSEKAVWDKERAALVERAEAAENQLRPVAEELSGLKRHIVQMSAAIFGKSLPCPNLILSIEYIFVYLAAQIICYVTVHYCFV